MGHVKRSPSSFPSAPKNGPGEFAARTATQISRENFSTGDVNISRRQRKEMQYGYK